MRRRGFLAGAALLALSTASHAAGPVADNVLVIEVEGAQAPIEIELLPQYAPRHVDRIKALAREGAYDGVAFHRVIDGFMAQTGDVKYGTREGMVTGRAGFGGSSLPDIKAEFSDVPFDEGVVGMARGRDPNSANSQFFIMLDAGHFLNGQYTVFGRVISGMETVHGIAKGSRDQNGAVPTPDFMEQVRIKGDPLPEVPAAD